MPQRGQRGADKGQVLLVGNSYLGITSGSPVIRPERQTGVTRPPSSGPPGAWENSDRNAWSNQVP
jgi:hypothetical protein